VCFGLLRFFFSEQKEYPDGEEIRAYATGFLGGSIFALICIITLNSVIKGGIWPFRGIGILTFNRDWGNGRGLIWSIAIDVVRRTPLIRNLFGAGCDCFCSYAYNIESVALRLHREWGDLVLTNAHNEALTMLVNQGVFGLVTYSGMIFVHLFPGYRLMDDNVGTGSLQKGTAGAIMAISAYMAVGLVGFWQILATPFLFIMLGVVAGLIKKDTITIMNCKSL